MIKYFKDIFLGAKSLLVGLAVTIRYMFKPIVTVQYPREKSQITPNYRGHLELVKDPETGKSPCIVCQLCAKSCPSGCITMEGKKPEGSKKKVLTSYRQDFTRCSLCGSCVEACSVDAIKFSVDYELVGFSREDFHFDLLKRLEAL